MQPKNTSIGYSDLIQVAITQASEAEKSLNRIVTVTGLESNKSLDQVRKSIQELRELEPKITMAVKLLKRSMKGESDIEKLRQIHSSLKSIENCFEKAIGPIKAGATEQDLLKAGTTEQDLFLKHAAQIIRNIAVVKNKAEKKINILQKRDQFKGGKLVRFDEMIMQLRKDEANQNDENKIRIWLLERIVTKMQLRNDSVNPSDFSRLMDIKQGLQLADTTQQVEFESFIQGLHDQINNAKEMQSVLIDGLCQEIANCKSKNQGQLPDDDKLKFIIQFRQIINNPFEIQLNFPELTKKIFTLIPESDMVQTKIPYSAKTLDYKMEGLKRIREQAKKNPANQNENVLISGAGPGGLMMSLGCALQGKPFTLIEVRSSTQQMRENVVALGKEDNPSQLKMLDNAGRLGAFGQGDLKLLDFFGVTDLLILNAEVEPSSSKGTFDAKIKDLQNGMIDRLCEMTGQDVGQLIQYNTEIKEIKKAGEKAEITLKTSGKNSKEGKTSPTMVYVMEGYRTKTRDMLGIDVIKESKATRFGVAFFKSKKAETVIEKIAELLEICHNILRALPALFSALPLLLKLMIDIKILKKENVDEFARFFHALGRAELAMSTPDTHYFYFTILKNESESLKELEDSIALADGARKEWANAIESLLSNARLTSADEKNAATALLDLRDKFKTENRKNWMSNAEELQKVFTELALVGQCLETSPTANFKEMDRLLLQIRGLNDEVARLEEALDQLKLEIMGTERERMDIIDAILEGKRMNAPAYESMLTPYSQVQRAETNFRTIGSTPFYVGGDAESVTDPVSGAGMRTTLLRTVIAATAFQVPAMRTNRFMQSVFDWSSHMSARSMREEGLHMRQAYMTGTERLERYIGISESLGVLDSSERELMLKWEAKAKTIRDFPKLELTFSAEEKKEMRDLQEKLYKAYDKAHKDPTQKKLEDRSPVSWSSQERDAFHIAHEAAKARKAIDDPAFSMDLFQKAAAKVAIARPAAASQYYYPEAWFVPLFTSLQEMRS